MAKPFVHLHVHSHYSLLDGLGKVNELVDRAKELGMPALALTDHGVMYGAIEFYEACQKAGLKPIIGVEAYVAPRKLTDKSSALDTKPYHLLLLAKNFEGYQNLVKLTTIAHLEGYYYRPRLDREVLSRHANGLIASSACLASETSRLILDKRYQELEKTVRTYQEIFGPDNYYLELQHHPSIPEQQVVNTQLETLAKKTGIPLIVTNDTHYVHADDHVSHDLLVCIQTGKLVSDTNRMIYAGDFSLKSGEEMAEAFAHLPAATANTLKIAELVNLEIPLGRNLLPRFPLPAGETEETYLKKLCDAGLHRRYQKVTPEIRQRLSYELETVFKTGFPGYFLIVADIARFAREQGILFGCRGSAAGSLISYIIGITDIDPLRYDLLFERFLDLNRISMPDIDMDFEDARRKEIIDYVRQKYGDSHVAGIITFGTIMARAAVRDVGRVLGVPYVQVDSIAKAVPAPIQGRHIPLEKSVQDAPELKELYTKDPQAKQILDASMKLEGTIRHASQHACAIVISTDPLDEYVPVQPAQGGDVHQLTQYSMGPIEKLGLLKMDFLGLSNYTIMHQASEIIEAVYGDKVDIHQLPLDNPETFELFGRGETVGIFQMESAGMRRYVKELQPNQFEDIIAMVALYRPGPMQWIQSYIDRKNGKEKIEYLHPLATDALKETYGIPIYQEQVMRMSRDMCGFTGSEADTLRKAIGKKIPKLMKEMREKFVNGAIKNGVTSKRAEEIWHQLEDFAAYCFNKSHAVCYALIAYQTAYLKAHYPDCFMAALMTSDLNNIDRLSIEIAECERLGLKVLLPDVNESFANFAVVKEQQAIRFGLAAVKNVGHVVASRLVQERKTNGPYTSLEDFLQRNGTTLNKKVLESLVKAGALDRFGGRASLYAGLELLVKFAAEVGKNNHHGQLNIFGDETRQATFATLNLPAGSVEPNQYLAWEKELLGLYLSDHPLKRYGDFLAQNTTPISAITLEDAGKPVRIGGLVHELKKITTKSNQMMAFAQIEDLSGTLEAVVFPNAYQAQQALWHGDQPILIEGKVNNKDGSVKVLVDQTWLIDALQGTTLPPLAANSRPRFSNGNGQKNYSDQSNLPSFQLKRNGATPPHQVEKAFVIEIPRHTAKDTIENLKVLLVAHPGELTVELRILSATETKIVTTPLKVTGSTELTKKIQQLLHSSVAA